MARKPATKDDEQTGLDLDDIYSAEPLSAALENLYTELDIEQDIGQVSVFISKIDAQTGKEARIWQGTPVDYDLNAIAKRFGSAEYRVKIYVPNPNGRISLRGNKVFKMELDPSDDARIEMIRKGIIQPAAAPAATLTVESIAAAVAQAIKAALPTPVAPALNPMDLLKGLADVMKAMTPAAQPGLNALESLKIAASIFREVRGNDDEREPIQRGVNATATDVFMKLIDKFGPALLAASGQGPQPGHPALPAPAAVSAASASSSEDAAMQFKTALAFLVAQAQADNDPTPYAGMVLDNISETDLDALLKNEQWLEYLATFEPRVMNQRKWFTELRDAVIELRAGDSVETAPDGEGEPKPAPPASQALTGKGKSGKTH